ncbi:MAG: potassium transporter TrkG [Actinomycetota bacterium]
MSRPLSDPERAFGRGRRDSYSRLAIGDGLAALTVVMVASALLGIADDLGDSLVLLGVSVITGTIGVGIRRTFRRRDRPPAARVISGLASTWAVLVLAGTVVYLLSGTADSLDEALFESAAGFSTVAATSLDPETLSTPIGIFRAGTQFVGGLVGLLAGVVALPRTMKGNVQIPKGEGRRADRLAPDPITGRRRVVGLYVGLTAVCGAGYLLTGLGARSSLIHAMTTLSTGGFSDQADSFASTPGGTRVVATVFMVIAGTSYFVLFWLLRGNVGRFSRSPELRIYLLILVTVTTLLTLDVEGLSIGDAAFTAASASSTTGFAVTDWTVFPAAGLSLLLVAVATGAMGASAGSGLRVIRAWLLFLFATREVRRQLDPNSVTLVRHGQRTLGDQELDSLTGYQIAHFGLCGIGAFLLALTGDDLVDALWTAISVVSTSGPSPTMGPFGDADQLGRVGQLVMIPGMLAGRLTILPLLLAVSSALQAYRWTTREARRLVRARR